MSRPAGYLTLEQAATLLGEPWCHQHDRRPLVRYLRARQKCTRRQILFPVSETDARHGYRTTRAALEACFPECFSHRDKLAELLQKEIGWLVEARRLDRMKLNALASAFRECRAACRGRCAVCHGEPRCATSPS